MATVLLPPSEQVAPVRVEVRSGNWNVDTNEWADLDTVATGRITAGRIDWDGEDDPRKRDGEQLGLFAVIENTADSGEVA
jgi:hypothetical protein